MSKKWTRRSALALIGSGAGLLTWGTGGFTDVTADRQVNIDTTSDSPDGPLLGIGKKSVTGGPGRTVSLIEIKNNLGARISGSDIDVSVTKVTDTSGFDVQNLIKNINTPDAIDVNDTETIEAILGLPDNPDNESYNVMLDITATAGSQEVTLSRTVALTYDDPRISWWNFEEVSGSTVPDEWSGNGATRANYNIVGYEPDLFESSSRGDVLSYDGTRGDVVEVSNESALNFTGEFSLSAWIYPRSQSGLARLFSKWDSSIENGYQFFLTSQNKIGIETATQTGEYIITDVSVNSGEWSHVVWTHGSSNDTVFLNVDEKEQYTDLGDPVGSDQPLRIGNGIDSRGNLNFPFYGLVDEPKIYDTALTEQQVRNLYNTSENNGSGSIGG